MNLTKEQKELRERYVIALIEATHPLLAVATDREVNLELLIQAAEALRVHLQDELEELRAEND